MNPIAAAVKVPSSHRTGRRHLGRCGESTAYIFTPRFASDRRACRASRRTRRMGMRKAGRTLSAPTRFASLSAGFDFLAEVEQQRGAVGGVAPEEHDHAEA